MTRLSITELKDMVLREEQDPELGEVGEAVYTQITATLEHLEKERAAYLTHYEIYDYELKKMTDLKDQLFRARKEKVHTLINSFMDGENTDKENEEQLTVDEKKLFDDLKKAITDHRKERDDERQWMTFTNHEEKEGGNS